MIVYPLQKVFTDLWIPSAVALAAQKAFLMHPEWDYVIVDVVYEPGDDSDNYRICFVDVFPGWFEVPPYATSVTEVTFVVP